MNILFICKYNRFRSKVAEAYFNKINLNLKIRAKSAGIILDKSPENKVEINAAKSTGININQEFQGISTGLLEWADRIIIVADDVPQRIFKTNKGYDKKILLWKITDNHGSKKENLERIINLIIKKVEKLVNTKSF
jgi:protein-tyrosine-phosphatase